MSNPSFISVISGNSRKRSFFATVPLKNVTQILCLTSTTVKNELITAPLQYYIDIFNGQARKETLPYVLSESLFTSVAIGRQGPPLSVSLVPTFRILSHTQYHSCVLAYVALNCLINFYYLSVDLFSLMVTYLRWEKCTFSSFAQSGSLGPSFLLLSSLGATWGCDSEFFNI